MLLRILSLQDVRGKGQGDAAGSSFQGQVSGWRLPCLCERKSPSVVLKPVGGFLRSLLLGPQQRPWVCGCGKPPCLRGWGNCSSQCPLCLGGPAAGSGPQLWLGSLGSCRVLGELPLESNGLLTLVLRMKSHGWDLGLAPH